MKSDPAKFQGFHAPHVLVIADEAAGISEKIFEGITAVLKGAHSRLLAIGNPTVLEGWFYEAFKSEGWHSIHISAFDTPNITRGRIVVPGLVTGSDIEQARIDYGEGSSLFQARVLGGSSPVFGTATVGKDGTFVEIGATFFADGTQGQIDVSFFPPTAAAGSGGGDYGAYGVVQAVTANIVACTLEP